MAHLEHQAMMKADPRSPWQRRIDALWKEAKWQIYLNVYCRFIYRPHMRLIHRFGWHWYKHLQPMGGPEQHWCQWCGDRREGSR